MAKHSIDQTKAISIRARVATVFSPTAPVDKRDLFAGRVDQLGRVFDAIGTRGQHVVIFGERGVGKTSLANIVRDIAADTHSDSLVVKVNCSKDDSFGTLWHKALEEIEITTETDKSSIGMTGVKPIEETTTAADYLPPNPTPTSIKRALDRIGNVIVILDEFDRMQQGTDLFADTIKTLSDASTPCTLILVGVANDINDLIREHASIDRSIKQIKMPRMGHGELLEILTKAMVSLDMTMNEDARELIVLLSQGLPHFTHVLGRSATIHALRGLRSAVSMEDVRESIQEAIENTEQSVRNAYQEATASSRKDTLYGDVLLACALASVDDLGYFTSAAVRSPLREITGKAYEIPGFSQHLNKFSSDERGKVLERAGSARRFRFRFSNPLLQPFVIMRGIADGSLDGDLLNVLRKKWQN